MKSKSLPLLAIASALGASASLLAPGRAFGDSINGSGAECQAAAGAQHDLDHEWIGTGTRQGAASRIINCAVPRSPLSGAVSMGTFEVSAFINTAGASIPCTLYSYDYTGLFLGSVAFTLTSPTHAAVFQQVSLPSFQLGFWAYTSMSCAAPANAGAFVTSIISMN